MKVLGGIAAADDGDITVSITQTKALLRQTQADASFYHPQRHPEAAQFLLQNLPIDPGWQFSPDQGTVVDKVAFQHKVIGPQHRVVTKSRKAGFAVQGPDGVIDPARWNEIALGQPRKALRAVTQMRKHGLDLIELRDVCLLIDQAGYVIFSGDQISPHTGAYPVFPPTQIWPEIALPRLYFAGDIHTHDNIAHFLLDTLCRAWMARDRFAMTGAEIGFPEYRLPYCTALQHHLFPGATTLRRGQVYRVARLYVTGYTLQIGALHPANALDPGFLDWLRQTAPQTRPSEQPDRIYISRLDAKGRPMVNETEIIALAEAADFTPVVMSKLPVEEQVGLFAGARTIIGAHGAGMANIAFCAPGTRVIELYSRDGAGTDAFQRLGTTLGLRTTPLFGTGVENTHPAFGRRGWTMDPALFRALLAQLARDETPPAG